MRAVDSLRGIEDQQIRNSLVTLQNTGRLLKTGTHAHYRYYLNPAPPPLRRDAAVYCFATGADRPAELPELERVAIAPVWPAPRTRVRLDRNPIPRITA